MAYQKASTKRKLKTGYPQSNRRAINSMITLNLQTGRLCSWWFALISVKRQVLKVTLSLRVSSPHNQCKTVLRFTIKQRIESRPISVCVASFPRAVTHRRGPGNSELPWNFHPGARQRFLAHVGHHVPLRTMLAFA